ncbi:short neuropeptide F [Anopheles cruzii]|uniref:short neuropeptide F n=1 Tax=Anopheles cruzii TaxID=68878 RepID=UPI0022EC968F|nr:short neuropeptide F [Anopheles cruzii]
MCRINVTTFTLLLLFTVGSLMSDSLHPPDGSIKDLYEYLLQREYAAPVSYADHQIKRKAVRSPSLRLRFGRRSDTSIPALPEDDDEPMDQRAIRAPQLRLRFGRNDPVWSSFNENALLEENYDKRAPSQKLRWGRSNLFGNLVNQYQPNDVMQQKTIRAPQLRLRFGRTDPSWSIYNEHQRTIAEQPILTNESNQKRAPTQRLRWGRSDPSLTSKGSTEDKTPDEVENDSNAAVDK